jgi:hypothetical protein
MLARMKFAFSLLFAVIMITGFIGIVEADTEYPITQSDRESVDGCYLRDFEGPILTIEGNTRYMEVGYEFDENCTAKLISVISLDYIPREQEVTADTTNTSLVSQLGSETFALIDVNRLGILATNTCHTRIWETDPFYIPTVETRNETTYTWNGTSVSFWGASGSWHEHFSWWYRSGSSVQGDWDPYPSNVTTRVTGSFYCNGGPFCGGGPMYHITLNARVFVNKSGSCSGSGTYSGTVCNLGGLNCKVFFSVWKD